jgi:hypothetical protein
MPGSLAHPATYIPARPAVLVVGDRQIPIDEWPLAGSVEERCSLEIRRPNGDLLAIEPKSHSQAVGIMRFVLTVLGGVIPVAIGVCVEAPWWLSIGISLIILTILLLVVRGQLSQLRWIRFDRNSGQLVIERRVGFRRKLRVERIDPLESIRAIQLLFTGRHSVTEPQGAGERQSTSYREFCGYELNLIVDDAKTPRLNLFSFSDWEWIRRTGQSLGEFLAVPVIDKLYHGG